MKCNCGRHRSQVEHDFEGSAVEEALLRDRVHVEMSGKFLPYKTY